MRSEKILRGGLYREYRQGKGRQGNGDSYFGEVVGTPEPKVIIAS